MLQKQSSGKDRPRLLGNELSQEQNFPLSMVDVGRIFFSSAMQKVLRAVSLKKRFK